MTRFHRKGSALVPVLLIAVILKLVPFSTGIAEQRSVPDTEGKIILGQIERVAIPEINAALDARIDTGAASSSLHATDLETFQRNGSTWVRFNAPARTAGVAPLERPVHRIARIRRRGGAGFEERPAILLELMLGQVSRTVSVTLADRTGFKYPLLIGRDFLDGAAIVDVSKAHTQDAVNLKRKPFHPAHPQAGSD